MICKLNKELFRKFFFIIPIFLSYVKMKRQKKAATVVAAEKGLLFLKGLAVGALIHGRIGFVSPYQNAIQGAEVFIIAVVCTLLNSTFDRFICFAIHDLFLLLFGFTDSMNKKG